MAGNGRIPTSLIPGMPPGSPALRGGGCEPVDPCLAAYFQEYERRIATSDLAPHIACPINGRYTKFGTPIRALINVPLATDADANLAGTNLAAAEGVFQTITPQTPTTATGPVTILNFQSPAGKVAIVKKWGISVDCGDPTACSVVAQATGGPTVGFDPPSPLVGGNTFDELEDVLILLPDGKALKVLVSNLDTSSPMLVTFFMIGWILERKWIPDDLHSLLNSKGFGVRS